MGQSRQMTLLLRSNTPLSHLLVLDMADEKASYCSRMLAFLGARVIKIENPPGKIKENDRSFICHQRHDTSSFLLNNMGKYGITLDLNSRIGRTIFRRLASSADILVETFPPGYLKKIRLDYKQLNRVNSRLIMVSLTGFGQRGPYSKYSSNAIIASAAGGQTYLSGEKGSAPLQLSGKQSYFAASLFACVGILIAIQARRRSGQGQYLDLSLQETTAATLGDVMVRYFHEGIITQRTGSMHINHQAGIFPCRDGFIYLSYEREWDSLVDWLSAEKMQADLKGKRWQEPAYRRRHYKHIAAVISKWTMSHNTTELFQTAQRMRFPWAPVNKIEQVLQNPQLKARGFFKKLHNADTGQAARYPGLPFKSSPELSSPGRKAPYRGEHNNLVYRRYLGFSSRKIDDLYSRNII